MSATSNFFDWLHSKEDNDNNLANGNAKPNPIKQKKIDAGNTPKPKNNSPEVVIPNEKPIANAADVDNPKLKNKNPQYLFKDNWNYVEPAALRFRNTTENPDATNKDNPHPPGLPRAPVRSKKGSQSRRTSW